MTRVTMFLCVMSMVMAAARNSHCPAGVIMCKRRCQEVSGCSMVDYVQRDLRCRLISGPSNSPGMSDAIRLDAKDVSAYKAMKCPLEFKWIFTKKASYTCVDPGTVTRRTHMHTSSVYGSSIAADETEDTVFLAAGRNIIHVLTCSLARKKGFRNIKAYMIVMSVEIIPILKRLYLTFRNSHDVVAVNYHGEIQKEFIYRERGLFTAFSPDGRRMYTTYDNGTMNVVQISYDTVSTIKTIQVSRRKSQVRVVVFNDKVLAFIKRMMYVYNPQKDMSTRGVAHMIPSSRMRIGTPVTAYVQPPIQVDVSEKKTPSRARKGIFTDNSGKGFAEEYSTGSKPKLRLKKTLSSLSDVWGKQRLLTVTNTVRKSTSVIKVFLGDPNSDKWKLVGRFKGVHIAMDYAENILYHCQKKPGGLFTLNLQDGRGKKKHKKIVDGACTSVAVDPVLIRVFFVKSSGVWSYNLVSKDIESIPIGSGGRMEDYRIFLEMREHMIYSYRLGQKRIRKFDHRGRFQTLFSTGKPIKDLIIYSGKSNSTLYCIHNESQSEVKQFAVPGWERTIDFRLTGTHKWKPISGLAAMDNKIILTHGRFLRVVDSRTLLEDSTVMSETFRQSFKNLLIIELQT